MHVLYKRVNILNQTMAQQTNFAQLSIIPIKILNNLLNNIIFVYEIIRQTFANANWKSWHLWDPVFKQYKNVKDKLQKVILVLKKMLKKLKNIN